MLAFHKVNNINAKVGIYLRISLEDGDKPESNSIDNQRKLIYEYLHNNNFINMVEFIDDGATGTITTSNSLPLCLVYCYCVCMFNLL